MDFEVNDLSRFGVVRDSADYMLPPEAFTLGENVRFAEDGVENIGGWEQTFGTPGVAPHFVIPLFDNAQAWWLYTSLTKAYVYDGSSHTNITRQTIGVDTDYTASQTRDWNGTILGGIPILNDGSDVPQYWASYSTSQKLQDLDNWDGAHRAKVIRALGPHLIAFNVTKGADVYPHMVKTSHPADPGSVPVSWDETDPTRDTTENDLSDVNSGPIVDALPMRGQMFIYKENATWNMRFIGGRFVWAYDTFLTTSGILAPRCVGITHDGRYHFVVTQDDIIVHDGQQVWSLLTVPDAEGRIRSNKKYLFDQIDSDNYANCFVFCNPEDSEMWFCYPGPGQTQPNRAFIWNYQRGVPGVWSEAVGITFRNAAIGPVASASGDWSALTNTWEEAEYPWSSLTRRKVILAGTDATKFLQLGASGTRDGTLVSSTLRRETLGILGRRRNGAPIEDFKQMKMWLRLWPKIRGGPVSIRVGQQEFVDQAVSWNAAQTFDPTTQMWLDVTVTGRALSYEISTLADVEWRFEGMKFEQKELGSF